MLSFKFLCLLDHVLAAYAGHISIALTRADDHISPRAIPDLMKRAPDNPGLVLEPEFHPSSGSLWYGDFDIGNSKNISMVIDTGTTFVYIATPGLYSPSSASIALNQTKTRNWNLNETRWVSFGQTQGNGCGNLAIWQNGHEDTMSFHGLTAKSQRFSVANKVKLDGSDRVSVLDSPDVVQKAYQGIVGFNNNPIVGGLGPPFLQNLYQQGQIEEPRFGLAFGTSGKGQQILGGVDENLFEDDLIEKPLSGGQWNIDTSSLTLNGQVVADKQLLFFDSGGPSIHGPAGLVGTLFKKAGMQAVETETTCGKLLYGYYACDAPPKIGFQIGGKNFHVEPAALKWKDDGANNCTAIMTGYYGEPGDWTVGQPFMQRKYIDHHFRNESMGFALLKDTAG